jgi:hypothetical protein
MVLGLIYQVKPPKRVAPADSALWSVTLYEAGVSASPTRHTSASRIRCTNSGDGAAVLLDVPSDERRRHVLNGVARRSAGRWSLELDPCRDRDSRAPWTDAAGGGRHALPALLLGASAALVFGHRPSTSGAPSACCRPFCYGLPGLIRSGERRTAIRADGTGSAAGDLRSSLGARLCRPRSCR